VTWLPRSKRTPIGIDISGRFVNAVQLRQVGRGWSIEAAVSLPRADWTVPLDSDEVARVADVLDRQGFAGRDVVLAMPNEHLMSKVLEVPAQAAPVAVQEIARAELAGAHKCPPDSLELACWRLPRPVRSQGNAAVIALACKQDEANILLDVFEDAGMIVRALDVQSWAMTRALGPILKASSGATAVLNIGWTASFLVVLSGRVVVYERLLAEYGLNRLYMMLTHKFDLEREVADYVLGEIGMQTEPTHDGVRSDLLKSVRGYIVSYLDKLVHELRLSLTYATQEYGDGSIDRLHLLGEGAAIPRLPAHLAAPIEVAVDTVMPANLARCPRSLEAACRSPHLCIALGLAQHSGA
jgi:type IV pilus assembly protein PilM